VRKTSPLAAVMTGVLLIAAMVFTFGNAQAQSNGGVRIMPLGDSITDGFNIPGGYRIGLWQRLVADGYRIDFTGTQSNGPASLGDRDHEGHSGWRIDQIDANIVNWLLTQTPRTVLLHIGTNDMIQNPTNAAGRLATLINRITSTAPRAEVFVATIIPLPMLDSTVRAFNAAIPDIVRAAGPRVHLVDMYNALTSADLADGVHPNATGYDKMAAAWYNALKSVPGSLEGDISPTLSDIPSSLPSSVSPPASVCTATYRVINSWGDGFQAEVRVENTRTTTLNGWTVRMTLPAGQSISSLWNGVASGSSGTINVRNAPYNGILEPNTSTTFGYVASGNSVSVPSIISCSSP